MARRADALETYVRDFATNDIDTTGYTADVTDTDAFDKTIVTIQSELGDPDVVVYNVGITTPDEDPLTTQDVKRHFAADVVGAYQTIKRFATDGFAAKGGAIVLTGGVFAVNPYPCYLCVSIDKAAVRALAQLKHDELKDRGIFVGSVMPCGVIGSNEHFAPANIAERYWEIVSRRDEVELRYELGLMPAQEDRMEYVTLNNGVEMPLVGYGTYRTPNRDAARLVTEALAAGYRHVDTAQCYGNEGGVGDALAASGIGRDDLFVTTKTWASGYTDTKRSIDASLKALRTDHIDLLLIHEPSGDVPGIWRALEEAYHAGKARSIGVSNFLGRDFDDLLRIASITPAVNQLECHVYRQQREIRRICEDAGVLMTSWSPLAAGKNGFFDDPTLQAVAKAHGVSVAQVGLRWLVQRGIPIIPKTSNSQRMRENLDIFGYTLTEGAVDQIRQLDTGKSQFGWW